MSVAFKLSIARGGKREKKPYYEIATAGFARLTTGMIK